MTTPDPTAPAADASYTPIVTDLGRLVRVLFSPGDVFNEQRDRPTFWWPFAILGVISVIVQTLQKPFQQRVQEIMMAQRGITAPPGAGTGIVSLVVGSLVGALMFLIILALTAGILYLLMAAFGGETTFKKMMTVAIFSAPLYVLQQVLVAVILHVRGLDAVHTIWDIIPALGADLLLPADAQVGAFLRVFLGQIGVLQIWGVAVTAVGLTVMAKVGKGAAWTAAIISFLVVAALASGLASLGIKAAGG